MADKLKLYLFGDQTYDMQSHVDELMLYRHTPALENFLVKAYDAVRREIFQLPREIRDNIPRLTCLDDLVFQGQSREQCVPLDMAVTCIYQLGIFIR